MGEILSVLELFGKYPTLVADVLGIIAEAPSLIGDLVNVFKAPSLASVQALVAAQPVPAQKLMAAVNATAQGDPAFIPAAIAAIAKLAPVAK
jgi:hypothetical protein